LDQLRLSHRAKDENIEQLLRPKRIPPTPLPPEADAQVNALLSKRGVVSKFAREQVNDQDLSRLRSSQWLNDEIINFYGAMILGRSEGCKENPGKGDAKGKKLLNVHYFSTFFWSKLKEGYDRSRLAKWTKKVRDLFHPVRSTRHCNSPFFTFQKIDIFSKDIILIPVNHSNAHWTGAAINFRLKRIESYDSMGNRRDIVFQVSSDTYSFFITATYSSPAPTLILGFRTSE
jgi:sentrin-specific protease 1